MKSWSGNVELSIRKGVAQPQSVAGEMARFGDFSFAENIKISVYYR